MTRDGIVKWLDAPAFAPTRLRLPFPILAGIVLAAGLAVLYAFTETYAVKDNLGDDGTFYAEWIRAYSGDIHALGFNSYNAQRSLGVLLVRVLLDAFHRPPTNPNIVLMFRYVDTGCAIIALTAWIFSAKKLDLSRGGFLVATALLYLGFAPLRWLPWDPVLTDSQGWMLGSIALALYLWRQPIPLAIVAISGSFMWPSFFLTAIPLLLFPRPPPNVAAGIPDGAGDRIGLERILGSAWVRDGLAAIIAAFLGYASLSFVDHQHRWGFVVAWHGVARLSAILITIVLFFALRSVIRLDEAVRELRRWDFMAGISRFLVALVFIAVRVGIKQIMGKGGPAPVAQPPVVPEIVFIEQSLTSAVQRPLAFLVAHVSFFGLGALVLMLGWRRIMSEARRYGFGFIGLAALAIIFGLNSQSRFMLPIAPILLPLGILVFPRDRMSFEHLVRFGLVALFASQAWYTIVQKPAVDMETALAHVGPWMLDWPFVVQGIGCVLVGIWFRRLLRKETGTFDDDFRLFA